MLVVILVWMRDDIAKMYDFIRGSVEYISHPYRYHHSYSGMLENIINFVDGIGGLRCWIILLVLYDSRPCLAN